MHVLKIYFAVLQAKMDARSLCQYQAFIRSLKKRSNTYKESRVRNIFDPMHRSARLRTTADMDMAMQSHFKKKSAHFAKGIGVDVTSFQRLNYFCATITSVLCSNYFKKQSSIE